MSTPNAKFRNLANELQNTQHGHERNMYSTIKEMLISIGVDRTRIVIDSNLANTRKAPDLTIKDEKGKPYAVIEVKDEHDAFAQGSSRESIFQDKKDYIDPISTAWFLMVDPIRFVLRKVEHLDINSSTDIELEWETTNYADFKEALSQVAIDSPAMQRLEAFRKGCNFGIYKLSTTDGQPIKNEQVLKRAFFEAIHDSTQRLLDVVTSATLDAKEDILARRDQMRQFKENWQGVYFEGYPPKIRTKSYPWNNEEEKKEFDLERKLLKSQIDAAPSIAIVSRHWLEANRSKEDAEFKRFASETSNLLLARILMMRFLEDHGFFSEKRYISNGGVNAFQSYREYFDSGYEALLQTAFTRASSMYPPIFEEMDFDWLLARKAHDVSAVIEYVLMTLSLFDFSTVQGDIMTGIYDRFLDAKQRKQFGEFYTPPSIARYMIDRLGLERDATIYDPACGSGTFLVAALQAKLGNALALNSAITSDVDAAISQIFGNDINAFSATVAQIQMLWNLLPHIRDNMMALPELQIASGHDSLVSSGLFVRGLFGEISQNKYDAVVGNPPYVRSERQSVANNTSAPESDFNAIGGRDKNLYTLFVYHSLKRLCVENGKLAFVIPLSFCETDQAKKLRELFGIGGEFTIREIVDMEQISSFIFDASVQPMILIAEAKSAKSDDTVSVVVATRRCVEEMSSGMATIDLKQENSQVVDYDKIWFGDKILTKITPERARVLDKLKNNQTFFDIARPYWTKRETGRVCFSYDSQLGQGWNDARMLKRGCVFRNKNVTTTDSTKAFDFYKGENIKAGLLVGDPSDRNVDIDTISDPSLWKFRSYLPDEAFAILRICEAPTALKFNPREIAFLDTATIFIPKTDFATVPFDLLLLSRVYRWFYGLVGREAAIQNFSSNLYPSNLGLFPWNDALVSSADGLETVRPRYLEACKLLHTPRETANDWLDNRNDSYTLNAVLLNGNIRVEWSVNNQGMVLNDDPEIITTLFGPVIVSGDKAILSIPSTVSNHNILSRRIVAGIYALVDRRVTKDSLLQMCLPSEDDLDDFEELVRTAEPKAREALESVLNEIDELVFSALGLTREDLDEIRNDLAVDPFLSKLQPKWPNLAFQGRGRAESLQSSERYR